MRCVGCRHKRHRGRCRVKRGWLLRLLGFLPECSCTYWDARWEMDD